MFLLQPVHNHSQLSQNSRASHIASSRLQTFFSTIKCSHYWINFLFTEGDDHL